MIQNERQFKITRAKLAKLEAALPVSQKQAQNLPPELQQAASESIQSQIDDLRAELSEYERLRSTKVDQLDLSSFSDLGGALIKARIARGYTQANLAKRLNLKPQQIQKYEATGYATAGLRRIQEVFAALEIDMRAKMLLNKSHKNDRAHIDSH